MLRKVNMISVSFFLTVIIFTITTMVQRALIEYKPQIEILVATKDVAINRPLNTGDFKLEKVPISMILDAKPIKDFSELNEKYAKEPIHKGQVLLACEIAKKNEIQSIDVKKGEEKVSIKIKSPENGLSYQIRTGDNVNLYFTAKYRILKDILPRFESAIGNIADEESYCTIKMLKNAQVLGIFNEDGKFLSDVVREEKIDTVVFGVNKEQAKIISFLKNQGSFDISGLSYLE